MNLNYNPCKIKFLSLSSLSVCLSPHPLSLSLSVSPPLSPPPPSFHVPPPLSPSYAFSILYILEYVLNCDEARQAFEFLSQILNHFLIQGLNISSSRSQGRCIFRPLPRSQLHGNMFQRLVLPAWQQLGG